MNKFDSELDCSKGTNTMAEKKYLASLSEEARNSLEILGENIAIARKARGWSQKEAAERFQMSKTTLVAVEKGDPKSSIGSYLAALDIMNLLDGLDSIAASHRDPITRAAKISPRR
ncbi:helix-turn-helix transcriptional regulator [Gilvimarinus chinensis]|uniref:helix-turn-helix transcriptional regulator n=1 Tax=Gilvimarinus chinensis TaxID=396005 RepID=UPI0012F98617|nr:helix-turn-helix transcriptional regulator [Gilvimarinus chinensis]